MPMRTYSIAYGAAIMNHKMLSEGSAGLFILVQLPSDTGMCNDIWQGDTGTGDWHMWQQLINSLPTNDGKCRHDLCELSISLWEFIWEV